MFCLSAIIGLQGGRHDGDDEDGVDAPFARFQFCWPVLQTGFYFFMKVYPYLENYTQNKKLYIGG